ncbi:MAG: 30S ribosomal protein S20 [Mariprofundaceae bacterium]
MANHASAAKRARQSLKIKTRNRSHTSAMRSAIKSVYTAIEAGDAAAAAEAFKGASSQLARAGQSRIIHPSQASRRVSRLNTAVKAMSA